MKKNYNVPKAEITIFKVADIMGMSAGDNIVDDFTFIKDDDNGAFFE